MLVDRAVATRLAPSSVRQHLDFLAPPDSVITLQLEDVKVIWSFEFLGIEYSCMVFDTLAYKNDKQITLFLDSILGVPDPSQWLLYKKLYWLHGGGHLRLSFEKLLNTIISKVLYVDQYFQKQTWMKVILGVLIQFSSRLKNPIVFVEVKDHLRFMYRSNSPHRIVATISWCRYMEA